MTTNPAKPTSPPEAAMLALLNAGLGAPAAALWADRIERACLDEDDQNAADIYGRVMDARPRGEMVGPQTGRAVMAGCQAWATFNR